MTTAEFRQKMAEFLEDINSQRSAYIKEADQSAGFIVQTFRAVSLTTASSEFSPGLIIGFPFKSIVFENASSDSVRIKCKFNSNDQGVSFQTYGDNASVRTDKMFSKAFLFWDAQAGETIDITVYVNADYFSGALKNSGGVSVPDGVFRNDGSLFDADLVAIANTTAVEIFPADTTRRYGIFQNNTGTSMFVGDATVTNAGATIGQEVPAGETFEWYSSAACYVYQASGGSVNLYRREHFT